MGWSRRAGAALFALGLPFWTALDAQEATKATPQETSQETGPLSAIDWLSKSLNERPAPHSEPSTSQGVRVAPVEARALGSLRRDAVGLISPVASGLPAGAMAGSQAERIVQLIAGLSPAQLPAMAGLIDTLLLAELDPPMDGSAAPDAVFYARLDALLRFGALEKAQALMERAGPTEAEIFRRWFDVSLLTGHDSHACNAMTANPDIAPTLPARVFCLSRTDDWAAASLTLDTGRALGVIGAEDGDLLAHFLDPEMFEDAPPRPLPALMTPLRFRLLDGIGETPATSGLPLAFAVADLRPTMGWKARLEAGERLARGAALSPEGLRSLYTERMPAASGGVWDRAEAMQAFDVAMLSGDPGAIANALPRVWTRMSQAGLGAVFAQLYGARLARLPLSAAAAQLALKIGLLSDEYEAVAQASAANGASVPVLARDRFAVELALGRAGTPPAGALFRAVADGFAGTALSARFAPLIAEGRLVEALLLVAQSLSQGAQSDMQDIADALVLLRQVGLLDVARRTALELLLLERG